MKTLIKAVTLLTLLALAVSFTFRNVEQDDKCCVSCKLPEIKYYSIVPPRCGESCLDPKDYWKYKIFEPGMKKAETNTPCLDFGYGDYEET